MRISCPAAPGGCAESSSPLTGRLSGSHSARTSRRPRVASRRRGSGEKPGSGRHETGHTPTVTDEATEAVILHSRPTTTERLWGGGCRAWDLVSDPISG